MIPTFSNRANDDRTLCRWRAHPERVRVSWRREGDGWRCTLTDRFSDSVLAVSVHRRPAAAAWRALCVVNNRAGVDLNMCNAYYHPHRRICL